MKEEPLATLTINRLSEMSLDNYEMLISWINKIESDISYNRENFSKKVTFRLFPIGKEEEK